MTLIRLAVEDDVGAIQKIANEPRSTVSHLGGFVMMEPIKAVVKSGSMLVAVQSDSIVGFSEALPFGKHGLKMSLVAVTPDLRRQKICTSLYVGWGLIASLQGRLYLQDHIISNNPTMPMVLPTLGFSPAVVLRSKVKRHHDLTLWYKSMCPQTSGWVYRVPSTTEYHLEDLERYHENFSQMGQLLSSRGRSEDVRESLIALNSTREYVRRCSLEYERSRVGGSL